MSDPFVVYLLCITKSEREGIGVAFIVFDSVTVSGVSQISAKKQVFASLSSCLLN